MTLKFDYSSRDTWETLTFDAVGDHFIDADGFKVPVRRVMCIEEQAIVTAARAAAHDAYGVALTTAQDSSSGPSDQPQTGADSFRFLRLHHERRGLYLTEARSSAWTFLAWVAKQGWSDIQGLRLDPATQIRTHGNRALVVICGVTGRQQYSVVSSDAD